MQCTSSACTLAAWNSSALTIRTDQIKAFDRTLKRKREFKIQDEANKRAQSRSCIDQTQARNALTSSIGIIPFQDA